jgi:hypothetical protein
VAAVKDPDHPVTDSVLAWVAAIGLEPSPGGDGISRSTPGEPGALALAASALSLARELDDPRNSATSKSMCAKTLLEILDRLRALHRAPDELDELRALRAARRADAYGPA